MSKYVPKHSQVKKEPATKEAPKKTAESDTPEELLAGQIEESASVNASEKSPEKTSDKSEPSTADAPEESIAEGDENLESVDEKESVSQEKSDDEKEIAGNEELVGIQDEELIDEILDADKAVRENPELANPLIVMEGISNKEAEVTLDKIRKRRWPVVIAVILTLILATGATTYYVLSTQAHQREANRAEGYKNLDEAISLIQESDQIVVALDAATGTEVTQANLSERKVLLEMLPATLETLTSAESYAKEALPLMTAMDDKEFAQHVIDAAVNRKDMLTSGEVIINKDIEAMNAAVLFGQAWELIVKADADLRATTELSKTGGYFNLQEAIEINEAISADLGQALVLLAQAGEAFSEADFSTVSEYVSLKIESVALAIEADQAVLDGDIVAFNTKNAEFSLKDAAVVEAANRIPLNPLSLITDAYEKSTAESVAMYNSARANAATADEFIREYVGVETQTEVQ